MKNNVILLGTLFWCMGIHHNVIAKDYSVVIIATSQLPVVTSIEHAFRNELPLLLPNDELHIEVHNAHGNEERARELVDLVAKGDTPDLLVSVATLATIAVYNSPAVEKIPKLFIGVADPINAGIVQHFGERSHANITGESHVLDAKVKLDMLDGLLKASARPSPLTIGLLHSHYPSSTHAVERLLALDEQYERINFICLSTPYIEGAQGLNAMRDGIVIALEDKAQILDGYWLSAGPLLQADNLVSAIYEKTKLLPLFAESIESVKDGALLGVVSDSLSIGQSAATRAKRILEGEKANMFPVTQMEKYTIAVNVSTAIKMQTPVPSTYLKLAENNVYR